MNIIVFLLKKFIFILNFSILMSSNLCLFPQSCGLRKKVANPFKIVLYLYQKINVNENDLLPKVQHLQKYYHFLAIQ